MFCQSYEVGAQQHATRPTTLRWKEWIPLMSQQLRLRNLIQIIAFNVNPDDKDLLSSNTQESNRIVRLVKSKNERTKHSFYYTLHLTTMSAPFYTSEKLDNENPKWNEIEMAFLTNHVHAAVTGIVVRLWLYHEKEQDKMITVWGVYFNGLVYLGPKLCSDPSTLQPNTIVFHIHGGYFTAEQCLKDPPPCKIRSTKVNLNRSDIKPSYNVNTLLRLHIKQQAIKKHVLAAADLREKISVGGFTPKSHENAVLRRLLNESRPKAPKRQEVLKARQQVDLARFRVELLAREKVRKLGVVQQCERTRDALNESNMDRGLELMSKYQNLHKDIERLKEWRKSYIDTRESFLHTNAQLTYRRRQLISELNLIYPIVQLSENKFSICDVHLPNSDVFNGNEEVMTSVALGFVAHLVQMVSIFLQVPLRYPIIHFSSRSKIIDHVADKIPDNDREFPLFSKGKDKLQFNYGVYLLNKNIAQLRWYCGIATRDLPATLPNIAALLLHRPVANGFEFSHRSMSGSSLDLRGSSQNVSPVGCSLPPVFRRGAGRYERGHRISKSTGSSEIPFSLKLTDSNVESVDELVLPVPRKLADPDVQSVNGMAVIDNVDIGNSASAANNLSYSLDKGLDEYEDIKKSEVISRPVLGLATQQRLLSSSGLVGSEPILTPDMHEKLGVLDVREPTSFKDQAQKRFLQRWHEGGGPGQLCSDDDFEGVQKHNVDSDKVFEKQAIENSVVDNSSNIDAVVTSLNNSFSKGTEQNIASNSSSNIRDNQVHKADEVHPEKLTQVLPSSLLYDEIEQCSFRNVQPNTVEDKPPLNEQVLTIDNIEDECFVTDTLSTDLVHVPSNIIEHKSIHDELGIGLLAADVISGHEALFDPKSNKPSISVANNESQKHQLENQTILDEVNEMLINDNLFASVASRTEALASRNTSFNRVRSRNSGSLDEGPS